MLFLPHLTVAPADSTLNCKCTRFGELNYYLTKSNMRDKVTIREESSKKTAENELSNVIYCHFFSLSHEVIGISQDRLITVW